MPYLKPKVVASAARALFGRAHPYCLVFFCMKAAGASREQAVKATSSSEPTPELLRLAGQPEGFSNLVAKEWDNFSQGLVTQPGGDRNSYTFYFPLCHKRNIVLRSKEANRNAVWTNLRAPSNPTPNSARFDGTHIFQMEETERNAGVSVRFKENYVEAAYWYYGPEADIPMVVPIEALAIWLHRSTEMPTTTTLNNLVRATIGILHLQPEELHFLFPSGQLSLDINADSFVPQFDLENYFRAVCLDPVPADAPTFQLSEEDTAARTSESWKLTVEVLGFRNSTGMDSKTLATDQIALGKKNLLFYGPPRTGKSFTAISVAADYLGIARDAIEKDPRFTQVQFHPGWTYGDFMRKVMPVAHANAIAFERVQGKFLDHCDRNTDGRSVFLVEEVNRANVAAVLGEAFHLMENSRRGEALNLGGSLPGESPKSLKIPQELLFLATANNVDRSTFPLDAALLARFSVIDVPADLNAAYQILQTRPGWTGALAESFVLRVISEAQRQTGYDIGQAFFYEMPEPSKANEWYRTALKPTLRLHLTRYKADVLEGVDRLIDAWNKR